jgi:hypothetical protein
VTRGRKGQKEVKDGKKQELELHLTEAELEALINAVNKISDSGFG